MTKSKKIVKEEIVKKISWVKKSVNIIKSWITSQGIEGMLGLILGLILWVCSFKIAAGFAFGVFATKNWDLAKSYLMGLLISKK